jgi:hypothetical protein
MGPRFIDSRIAGIGVVEYSMGKYNVIAIFEIEASMFACACGEAG